MTKQHKRMGYKVRKDLKKQSGAMQSQIMTTDHDAYLSPFMFDKTIRKALGEGVGIVSWSIVAHSSEFLVSRAYREYKR